MKQYSDLKKIIGSIYADGSFSGSAVFLHSANKSTDYCITAYHCIFDESGRQSSFSIKLDNINLSSDNFEPPVFDAQRDILILKLNVKMDYPDIQSIVPVYDNAYRLIGYPNILQGNIDTEQISLTARFNSSDNNKYRFNMNDLPGNDKIKSVEGVSGGGFFEENSNGFYFIGIENEALNDNADFNLLSCLPKSEIDNFIREHNMEPLSESVPRYALNHTVVSEALSNKTLKSTLVKNSNINTVNNRIRQYYLDYSSTGLFICGQSGIGKTRSVLEACAEIDKFAVYFAEEPAIEDLKQLCTQIENHIIVVDESNADFLSDVNNKILSNSKAKIIVIGTIRNSTFTDYSDNVLRLTIPDANDVVSVIKASYTSFDEDEYNEIFKLSRSDLRLALLIADIYSHDKCVLSSHPSSQLKNDYNSAEKILKKRFKMLDGLTINSEKIYSIFQRLSVFIDIGFTQTRQGEIQSIASFWNDDVNDYLNAIDIFIDADLGIKKGFFFEESPRALSKLAFEQGGWQLIRHRITDFLDAIPNYELLRRFLERTRECSGIDDHEVATYFLAKFPTHSLEYITSDNCDTMALFIEYFPKDGLGWLYEAITCSDCSNFYERERQVIVHVCEKLSFFKEHFYICEEILFSLAQNETDTSYSNNSQGTWADLFAISLSTPCVSFSERYSLFLKRAGQCTGTKGIAMLNKAFEGILCTSRSHIAAPKSVGGMITPKPFSPESLAELIGLIGHALSELEKDFDSYSKDIQAIITNCLIKRIEKFTDIHILSLYKHTLDKIRLNRISKNDLLNELFKRKSFSENIQNKELTALVNSWILELEDTSTLGKVDELLHRNYWTFGVTDDTEKVREQFIDDIAKEFIESNSEIPYAFFDEKCDGYMVYQFGYHIAINDSSQRFYNSDDFAKDDMVFQFIKGYLQGIYGKEGTLPRNIYSDIDNLKSQNPDRAVILTIFFDLSAEGLDKIIHLLNKTENTNCLFYLQTPAWNDFLTEEQKINLIDAISTCTTNGFDMLAELLACWNRLGGTTDKIMNHFINTLEKMELSYKENRWFLVFSVFGKAKPEIKYHFLKLVLKHFDFNKTCSYTNGNILKLMKSCVTPDTEKDLMGLMGHQLIKSREEPFLQEPWYGIFDTFSVDTVIEWINDDPDKRAPLVTYHLLMPTITSPEITPLTSKILNDFDGNPQVEKELLSGQFHHIFISADLIYCNKKEWLDLTEKYKYSSNSLIRKWAIEKEKWVKEVTCREETRRAELRQSFE